MPIIKTLPSSRRLGSGWSSLISATARVDFSGMTPAGSTSINAGQSPSRQVKSLLQEDWWIAVFLPNSVSTGCTERQLDFSPQSPQPSHTASLMNTAIVGSATLPRLRSRRNSAAHGWSYIKTVHPGVSRRIRCASSRRSRYHTSVPSAKCGFSPYFSVSWVRTMTFVTPSASSERVNSGTVIPPSTSCPPVIATAAL